MSSLLPCSKEICFQEINSQLNCSVLFHNNQLIICMKTDTCFTHNIIAFNCKSIVFKVTSISYMIKYDIKGPSGMNMHLRRIYCSHLMLRKRGESTTQIYCMNVTSPDVVNIYKDQNRLKGSFPHEYILLFQYS